MAPESRVGTTRFLISAASGPAGPSVNRARYLSTSGTINMHAVFAMGWQEKGRGRGEGEGHVPLGMDVVDTWQSRL